MWIYGWLNLHIKHKALSYTLNRISRCLHTEHVTYPCPPATNSKPMTALIKSTYQPQFTLCTLNESLASHHTRLSHVTHTTHSYVWDTHIWLIHMCDVTHSCMWHKCVHRTSFSIALLKYMTHSYVWHMCDLTRDMSYYECRMRDVTTWLMANITHMTQSYVWHVCEMTRDMPYYQRNKCDVCHDSWHTSHKWLIHMSHVARMTHSSRTSNSFI